jgi:hypothetical protein
MTRPIDFLGSADPAGGRVVDCVIWLELLGAGDLVRSTGRA